MNGTDRFPAFVYDRQVVKEYSGLSDEQKLNYLCVLVELKILLIKNHIVDSYRIINNG